MLDIIGKLLWYSTLARLDGFDELTPYWLYVFLDWSFIFPSLPWTFSETCLQFPAFICSFPPCCDSLPDCSSFWLECSCLYCCIFPSYSPLSSWWVMICKLSALKFRVIYDGLPAIRKLNFDECLSFDESVVCILILFLLMPCCSIEFSPVVFYFVL